MQIQSGTLKVSLYMALLAVKGQFFRNVFLVSPILPKNERKSIIIVKSNFFVYFLEELRIAKSSLEIN